MSLKGAVSEGKAQPQYIDLWLRGALVASTGFDMVFDMIYVTFIEKDQLAKETKKNLTTATFSAKNAFTDTDQ